MAFDQATRNRLQRFVNDARRVLEEEFTRQLQNDYGMDPNAGTVAELVSLRHINDAQRETARILRDTLAHYSASGDMNAMQGLDRIVREQAFTVLNRLAALRMAESRGLIVESVGNGFQAKGFQLYARLAGTGLGETSDAYRVYLFSVFDELSRDLPGLFSRYAPQGRLFPRETALMQVLKLINDPDIVPLWSEDETIGWIYQYFNSKEERKAMRDASQAPRNSRELAVRNQFFTPRYVVEFLVDNTLGRLWFNVTGGKTVLREKCQYLLIKPDDAPQAATKLRDPRTLKLLDPACGSMHFGLYAFDLFIEIYCEAWAWEQQHGPGSLDVSTQPLAAYKPLNQTYEDEAMFLRDVPRLIIEHNIFGVDIDPRAAQIASLALWLRAQRAWHDSGVTAKDRPLIGKGNVIAAIAPPAEPELREQLASNLDQCDAELFEKTLQLLKGLPELGALLQVERELPKLIRQVYGGTGTGLFAEQDKETWQQAEARLYDALNEFAQAAKSTFQGRLFAQDALQGLRMIDLCREVFDVVVMNPPFGSATSVTDEYLKIAYPISYYDLYAAFVDRAIGLMKKDGFVGCITSKTFFSSSRLVAFRKWLLMEVGLDICADLGQGVLDNATVETAAYIMSPINAKEMIAFIDLKNEDDRKATLLALIKTGRGLIYNVPRENLYVFPNASLSSYWGSQSLISIFKNNKPLDPTYADTAQGQATGNDFRFVRARWEIPNQNMADWKPFAKGGEFFRYTCDWPLIINWSVDAINEYKKLTIRSVLISRRATDFDGRIAFAWNRVNEIGFNVRILPIGAKFSDKAPAIFPHTNPYWLIAVLCSRFIDQLCALQNPNRMFEVRDVSSLPIPDFCSLELQDYAKEIISLKRKWFKRNEVSAFFYCFTDYASKFKGLIDCFESERAEALYDQRKIQSLQTLIDNCINQMYQLQSHDSELLNGIIGDQRCEIIAQYINPESIDYNYQGFCKRAFSYFLGIAYGRWDVRFCNSHLQTESISEHFAPLPSIPPGMFLDSHGKLINRESLPEKYPINIPFAGVLADDEGHLDDIINTLRNILCVIWQNTADQVEEELCNGLNVKDLRDYLNRPSGFFTDHLRCYSESARKAPIFWPLSTPTGSYTLWIYYPNLTSQTLYTAINDFIEPKLQLVGADVTQLRNKGKARTRDDEKQWETLQVFEQELIVLRDTLLKIAPTYSPNHDDGVQISAAPLWKLFRHKPWQKVLQDTWTILEQGEYDWAHLAMNYWPERVREKCKTDKSLAIAHGLEDLYIEPDTEPKKGRGKKIIGDDE